MGGHFEGQPGDDHLRQGVAGHVDAGPKTIGTKEDAVARLAQFAGKFGARIVAALHEKRPVGAVVDRLQRFGYALHVEITGEQHQCSALGPAGAEVDVVGEYVERQPGVLRAGQRHVGGYEDTHAFLEIKGRVLDRGLYLLGADARLERLDFSAHRQGGAGEDHRGAALD